MMLLNNWNLQDLPEDEITVGVLSMANEEGGRISEEERTSKQSPTLSVSFQILL